MNLAARLQRRACMWTGLWLSRFDSEHATTTDERKVVVMAHFRPWNVDAIAEVVQNRNNGDIVIAYEHDPQRQYTIERREIGRMGRFVGRAEFRPLKREVAA